MAEVLDGEYEARVPLDRLVQHPRNPRRGNVGRIEQMIEANKFHGALLVQRSTGFVLAGNHRMQAAAATGLTELPVLWLDVDDDEALRILLSDNRAADDATYDDTALAALLAELEGSDRELVGTGYSSADLEALLDRLGADVAPAGLTDPDDAPPKPPEGEVITTLGEEWVMGRHRLIIGDSRDPLVVEKALQGRLADMVWTDPPYGVDYEGKTEDKLKIEGDTQLELEQLIRASLTNARTWTRAGGAVWVAGPTGPPVAPIFARVLSDLKLWRQTILWVKDAFVLGRQDYQGQFEGLYNGDVPGPDEVELGKPALAELVLAGWKPGARHTATPDRRQSNVWEIPRPRASKDHPTMKPVALVERAVRNHSAPGEIILDLFGGSGSTLIACHRAGRTCAMVELDPGYADVILRRWEAHTGAAPRRAGDEVPTSFRRASA